MDIEPWIKPWRHGFDCMNDAGNCGDCGNGPDDLCPLLAAPSILAMAATVVRNAASAPSSSGV